MPKPKLLAIGLDGASPLLIEKWIEDLPNLRRLAQSGSHGVLQSIVPPSSVPAWQCFATGKNPARLGLFGFATINRQHELVRRSMDRSSGAIWDVCSRQGFRVGVFNVPGTYPPPRVNGFFVSGFPVPPGKDWAYPRELMRRLDREVDGYEVDVPLTKPSEMKGGETAYLSQVERLHWKSLQSALALIDWYQPDFYFLTLQGVDMVQHDFWRYMDREGSVYSPIIRDWYIKLDSAVGELVARSGPETHVLILSDHGSFPVSMSFHVNGLLEREGFLKLKDRKVKHKGASYTKMRNLIMRNFPSSWVNTIYKAAPDFLARRLTVSAKLERFLTDLLDNIDWDETSAFSTGGVQANIYMNTDSRMEKELDRLCQLFNGLKHPATGEKLRAVFHHRNEVFSGPFVSEAPDVCIELFYNEQKVHVNPTLGSNKLWSFEPHLSAEHVREGYWSLSGPEVTRGRELQCSLLDLYPTMLQIFGMKPSDEVDGKVLGDVLKEEIEVQALAINS